MKNKILKIIIIVMCICICILLFYKKDDNNNNNENNENNNLEEVIVPYQVLDISECSKGNCDLTFEVGNDIIKVFASGINETIRYNNEIIYERETQYAKLDNKIYAYEKALFFAEKSEKSIKIYRKSNNYDIVFGTSYISDESLNLISYTANKNIIELKATKLYDNELILADDVVYVDSCEKFNKYKDEIVEGTYIIRYLDNNEFSNMELVESKKLKDVKELSSLCK